MAFADLKNDFVFRRILATHPDNLRGLLNDLLDRQADKAMFSQEELDAYQKVIDEIEQVRELAEAKLAEGEIKGKVENAARNLLTVLKVRAIAVSDAVRERILAEKDPELLERGLE